MKEKKPQNKLKLDYLPDHILIDIFSYLNKRDLCSSISLVCKRWNYLSYTQNLWKKFTLLTIKNPSWCKFKLVTPQQTYSLIDKRFSQTLQHIDISKLCFSFDILQQLFKNCYKIKSLIINFKYFQLNNLSNYKLEDYLNNDQIPSTIEYLYLKNVCDQKLRFSMVNTKLKYNLYELEIIKLIKLLLNRNKFCLKYLGFKCVDPTIITQECLESMKNIEILLLNNVNDTDSVLEELSMLSNLRAIELCKCESLDGNGFQDIFDVSTNLETIQLGKSIKLSQCELDEIDWKKIEDLKELYLDSADFLYQLASAGDDDCCCFSCFKALNYLALNNYDFSRKNNYFPYLVNNNFCLKTFCLRPDSNNGESLSMDQVFLEHLERFISIEFNIEYLDLIGINLVSTEFVVSIIDGLKNLK